MVLAIAAPAVLAGDGAAARAQIGATADAQVAAPGMAITATQFVTFDALARAPGAASYRAQQRRRFLDVTGRLVQVRETLEVARSSSGDAPFSLAFGDVVGSTSTSERNRWSRTYALNAGLIHRHGSFAVRDIALARQNYTLHDFGDVQRANRLARRVVVFPRRLDKTFWVVDLDRFTGAMLYAAEFDLQMRLLGELEVTSFQQVSQRSSDDWAWQPRMIVSRYASIAQARLHLAGQAVVQPDLVGPGRVLEEYALGFVQLTEDPVNGDKTLVLGYTDGVDEFFVMQDFGGRDPFPQPQTNQRPTQDAGTHRIASWDDPSLRVYVFHAKGVTYKIAGRSSLARLRDAAYRLCRQVVTGN